MTKEALRQALDALESATPKYTRQRKDQKTLGGALDYWKLEQHQRLKAITALKEALAQHKEQEPVAWLLTDKNINSIQVDSIHRLIDRLKHAHHTDLCVRINGQDEWFQADWLKHMVRATPPQRTWVGLTDEEMHECWDSPLTPLGMKHARMIEAKLKQKNGFAEEKNT